MFELNSKYGEVKVYAETIEEEAFREENGIIDIVFPGSMKKYQNMQFIIVQMCKK